MQQRPGRNGARRQVPRSTDDGVIGRHHDIEEFTVQVVESGPGLGDESLADESAGEQPLHHGQPIVGSEFGRRGALQRDHVSGTDLLGQLPQQRRHPGYVHEAKQGVVGGTGHRESFIGGHREGFVVPGMEDAVHRRRVAVSIQDLQIHHGIGVRPLPRHDAVDTDRLSHRQPDHGISGDAVAHRGRRIVARGAEVALAVDQRVTQRPRLGHPDQGVVDRRVAVRVIVTHRLGHRSCRLRVTAVGPETGVEHGVQHAAVHGLEAVAHLGQCAPDDDAHRVVDVAALHLLLDIDRLDAVAGFVAGRQCGVSHESVLGPEYRSGR